MLRYAVGKEFCSVIVNIMLHNLLVHCFSVNQAFISKLYGTVSGDCKQMATDTGIQFFSVSVYVILRSRNSPQNMNCFAVGRIFESD